MPVQNVSATTATCAVLCLRKQIREQALYGQCRCAAASGLLPHAFTYSGLILIHYMGLKCVKN